MILVQLDLWGFIIYLGLLGFMFGAGRVTVKVEYGMSRFWYESWKEENQANEELRKQLTEKDPYR